MQFGILPPYRTGVTADPTWMTDFARHAEEVGFESIYLAEHVVVPAGYESRYPYSPKGRMPLPEDCPLPDPLELLTFLAAVTERLVLATGVLVLPEHNPVILAKRVATLDVLSGGRARLGIGLGWMREEVEAVGVDFDSRGARTDEMIDALRVLWTEPEPTFAGEHFAFERAISRPQPRQVGGVPIHVGGHSAAAARRAGRVAEGFQPLGLDGDALTEKVAVMRAAANDAGRDPDIVELSLSGVVGGTSPDDVKRAEDAGAVRLVMGTRVGDWAELKDDMSRTADTLIHA
jgi:probable F420-dependent oxidoreductase